MRDAVDGAEETVAIDWLADADLARERSLQERRPLLIDVYKVP